MTFFFSLSRRRLFRSLLLGLGSFGLALSGCVGEEIAGKGDLALTISGGEALRDGFPHKEGDTLQAFADGWSLKFTKFIVSFGQITLRRPDTQEEVGAWKKSLLADVVAITQGPGASGVADLVTIQGLPARRLDIGFDLPVASAEAERRGVSADDAKEMIDKGWSLLLVGEAKKEQDTLAFRFGLPLPVRYSDCTNGKDSTQGIAIEGNKTTPAQIYLHPIHMFWNSLGATAGVLRFDAFAAVATPGQPLTSDDLAKQKLTDLRSSKGSPLTDAQGKPVLYDDSGLLPPDQLHLLAFFKIAVRESIHFNGLGLCKSTLLPPR